MSASLADGLVRKLFLNEAVDSLNEIKHILNGILKIAVPGGQYLFFGVVCPLRLEFELISYVGNRDFRIEKKFQWLGCRDLRRQSY